MKIISLFDGMSCGLQALKNLDIPVDNYYASEIDKPALEISEKNHPEIIRIGDVRDINPEDYGDIELLMGGSPCQNFSFAGTRKGMVDDTEKIEITSLDQYLDLKSQGFKFKGQSYLFWEYVRIWKGLRPKYFLLENVVMSEKWRKIFDEVMGVKSIVINSSSFNAQNRRRLFWTNIPNVKTPKFVSTELVEDILDIFNDENKFLEGEFVPVNHTGIQGPLGLGGLVKDGQTFWGDVKDKSEIKSISSFRQFQRVYSIKAKSTTLTTSNTSIYKIDGRYRRINTTEMERLQGLPDGYTEGVSTCQRTKMIGNGWSIPVIEYILGGIR